MSTNAHGSQASTRVLYGIPPPLEFESPCSWLTRAALSQGTSPSELSRLFGIKQKNLDLDISLTKGIILKISSMCGLSPLLFDFGRHMFTGLQSFDPKGRKFLMFMGASPKYRYCPVCLREQPTKHFPVHWRFNAWHYCPLHSCMMEDFCRQCGMFIRLPGHLMNAGPKDDGIAFLNQCLGCGGYLDSHCQEVNGILKKVVLDSQEVLSMKMGRSVLAAIYFRGIYWPGLNYGFNMNLLKEFAATDIIPHEQFLLDALEVGRRPMRISPYEADI